MVFHLRSNKLPVDKVRCFIYCIKDPKTKKIVYIGSTSNFKSRKAYHINNGWERNKKCQWIKEVRKKGRTPIFEIIHTTETRTEALAVEQFYIDCYDPILNTKK